ncbi:MAG: hypothetical protein M3O98_02410 [Actinomycetota bacterium]|nr:hypothetical protein [Actinomycetota bacterium]
MSPTPVEPPEDAGPPKPGSPDPFPFSIPVPKPAPRRRSTLITAAGVVLLLTGVLAVLGFIIVLSTNQANAAGATGQLTRGAAFVFFALAAMNLLAAALVLRLRPNGRTIGLIAAAVGIVIGLGSLRSSPGRGLLTLALDGFVAWVLATEADAFGRGGDG